MDNRYTMDAGNLLTENHTLSLGFGVVFDDKSPQPWYNYYIDGWITFITETDIGRWIT